MCAWKNVFLTSLNFSPSLIQDCKTPLNTSRPNWYAHNKFDRMPRLLPASCEFLWNQKYIVFTYTCTLKSLTCIFLVFFEICQSIWKSAVSRKQVRMYVIVERNTKNLWYCYILLPNKLINSSVFCLCENCSIATLMKRNSHEQIKMFYAFSVFCKI